MTFFDRIRIGFSALLLAGFSVSLSAQSSQSAMFKFKREEVTEVHAWLIQGAEKKIFDAVMAGRLKAYQDSGRIYLWSPAEVKAKFTYCMTIQIPVDIVASILKDTTVCEEPEAGYFRLHRRFTARTADRSLGFGYRPSPEQPIEHKLFVSEKEAAAFLASDEKLVFTRVLNELKHADKLMDEGVLEAATDSIFLGLARPIYHAAMAGRLKIYFNDSFQRIITPARLKELGTICETVNIPRDINDPYDMYDSTICSEFDPNNIAGLAVTEQWVLKGEKGSYRSLALAPTYTLKFNGVELNSIPMFQARWSDAMKHISKDNQAYLQTLIHYIHMRRMNPREYGVMPGPAGE